MSADPQVPLTAAPGAKAAKVCGILALVCALTCAGFPAAIVLGIVALVKHGKARRLARAQPDRYQPVRATGLVTGIAGLALGVLLVPVGLIGAVALPAFLVQRERARAVAVQANLKVAQKLAEATVADLYVRTGRVPSQDAVIRALAADPAILALRNPVTPAAPALQRGPSGPLGTVMVYADQTDMGGVTTLSLQFRAVVMQGGQQQILRGEVITHTEEHVQQRTPDGWEVVQPPADPPAAAPATPEPKP